RGPAGRHGRRAGSGSAPRAERPGIPPDRRAGAPAARTAPRPVRGGQGDPVRPPGGLARRAGTRPTPETGGVSMARFLAAAAVLAALACRPAPAADPPRWDTFYHQTVDGLKLGDGTYRINRQK